MIHSSIHAPRIPGEIFLPPSKSYTMRALMIAMFSRGSTYIDHPLMGQDTKHMLGVLKVLAVPYTLSSGGIEVGFFEGLKDDCVLDAGNSGQIYRFMLAILSMQSKPVSIKGDASLRYNRPIDDLLNALSALGVKVHKYNDGDLICTIQGPWREDKHRVLVQGSDSQVVSALMLSAVLNKKDLTIEVRDPGEIPWVGMTQHILKTWCQAKINSTDAHCYHVLGHETGRMKDVFQVPYDASSALYPVSYALVTGQGTCIEGVDIDDGQPDWYVIRALMNDPYWQSRIYVSQNKLRIIQGTCYWAGGCWDMSQCIDALPMACVLSVFSKGPVVLDGIHMARFKESNRVDASCAMIRHFGLYPKVSQDTMIIVPRVRSYDPGYVCFDSYDDHRMAMSAWVLLNATLGKGKVRDPKNGIQGARRGKVNRVACIDKSFPNFMRTMGFVST